MRDLAQWVRYAEFGIICHSYTYSDLDGVRILLEQWRRIKDTDDKVLPVFVAVRSQDVPRTLDDCVESRRAK